MSLIKTAPPRHGLVPISLKRTVSWERIVSWDFFVIIFIFIHSFHFVCKKCLEKSVPNFRYCQKETNLSIKFEIKLRPAVKTEHRRFVKKYQYLSFSNQKTCEKISWDCSFNRQSVFSKVFGKNHVKNDHISPNSQLVITDVSKNHQPHHKCV